MNFNRDVNEKKFNILIREIRKNPGRGASFFNQMSVPQQAQACLSLGRHVVYDILSKIPDSKIIPILQYLDPDEATDLIQLFHKRKQHRLLVMMKSEMRDAVEKLLRFDPASAAGLMDVDYIQVSENDTIAEVSKQFKVHEKRTGRLPVIIVLSSEKDENGVIGFLPGHQLGFAFPYEKAKKYVSKIPTIPYDATHEETIELFRTNPHAKIAVTGKDKQILGIIYSDNVLRLLRERSVDSLYDFAGVSKEESVYDNALQKIKFRYKWLIINLGTAFFASFTVSLFDETISKYVLLAIYMPIIAGMGGNAGTQTMAVMVRGLALKQIGPDSFFSAFKNEMISGFVNGTINGLLVAMVVLAVNHDTLIALVLFMAMIINLVVAAAAGTVVPLVMQKMGKDPASSATIFITTATDVLGFLAFLGLATLILP